MILKPDTLPMGAPYAIGAAIVYALRADEALQGAAVIDNPMRASDLVEGGRIVFFEDQHDKPRGQPGQRPQRSYAFAIGVINRTENARNGAHADYRAAKRAVRSCMPAINALVTVEGAGMVEGDVRYRLENIDVGGGLVLGMFTLDYRDPG
ncbi:hypothetical protein [Acidovorax sp. SUPP2825]|uniref:hypothetical protein n=1 Tax=Acidovorax sp. SUPP2825 TaxID=2920879 RepID=UPI0023DE2C7F|nr:hypothetical protein [Acidovorax sp. SUPP2825]GKS96948.1 hypothetical protein AVAK2825_20455 [Acidovorax sp. SUPP2825]